MSRYVAAVVSYLALSCDLMLSSSESLSEELDLNVLSFYRRKEPQLIRSRYSVIEIIDTYTFFGIIVY